MREAIISELPDFTNRLVLLMNAGMVLSQAIEKIANEPGNSFFYSELSRLTGRVNTLNTSLPDEIRELARRSGVRELLRLSNIITDNFDKGSELVSKLEQEAGLMWHMSRKQVEEKGRLAESKMTFPMALMLLPLIVITAAPAFMIF